jgi:hypothetical protein
MKLSKWNFRDLYKQCVIVSGEWIYSGAEKTLSEQSYIIPPGMNAALCFCYIDEMAGMTFHFLCLANIDTGEIDKKSYGFQMENKTWLMFRANPEMEIKSYTKDVSCFNERVQMVDEGYHGNKKVLPTREIKEIDHLRHLCYPDDVQVLLQKNGVETEYPWVKLLEIKNGELIGVLLNEPHNDFGIHSHNEIKISLVKHEDKTYAVCRVRD